MATFGNLMLAILVAGSLLAAAAEPMAITVLNPDLRVLDITRVGENTVVRATTARTKVDIFRSEQRVQITDVRTHSILFDAPVNDGDVVQVAANTGNRRAFKLLVGGEEPTVDDVSVAANDLP